jgi:hypothetical protein
MLKRGLPGRALDSCSTRKTMRTGVYLAYVVAFMFIRINFYWDLGRCFLSFFDSWMDSSSLYLSSNYSSYVLISQLFYLFRCAGLYIRSLGLFRLSLGLSYRSTRNAFSNSTHTIQLIEQLQGIYIMMYRNHSTHNTTAASHEPHSIAQINYRVLASSLHRI